MSMKFSFAESFKIYLQGGFPLIAVNTVEVDRASETMQSLTTSINKDLPRKKIVDEQLKSEGYVFMIWDCHTGWHQISDQVKPVPDTADPVKALEYMLNDTTKAGVYILQNFHLHWSDQYVLPMVIQLLRSISTVGKTRHRHLFLVGDNSNIPVEIQRQIVMLEFMLPNKEELEKYVSGYIHDMDLNIKKADILNAAEASLGMSLYEVESAMCVALVSSKGKSIDKNVIFEEKANAVKRSGLLEWIPTDIGMDSVGGLTNMKRWFSKVAKAFKDVKKAKEYNLPSPKGCITVGISGTGKSLSGKAVANLFGVPLFRCDIGRVFGGIVGETERNTRELFKLAEALAPCVILIDELEKALAGLGSSDHSDAGVTARFIGNLLYWLEEKKAPIFIMATANDVTKLPPELLRKGRFEELWFVDLPSSDERKEIFDIHIKKVGREPKKYDTNKLAKESDGLTGAEIENCIRLSLFEAFDDNMREPTTKDILTAIKEIAPLVKTKAEDIEKQRKWSKGKAKLANITKETESWNVKGNRKRSMTLN